ncbi:MAG TPA: alanine racemase [Verrucomicrobiae bacterium]|nr:alanine racemase [Verrucomicrobiae bacterium]
MALTWIEISKSALLNNIAEYRRIVGRVKLMAIVKSNAYGHGIDTTAEVINENIDWFGVVNGAEAIHLRDLGINKPILVLSYYDEDLILELIRKNISLAVYDTAMVNKIDSAARKLNTKARIHLKVDTGTTRLGVFPVDLVALTEEVKKRSNLELEGLFSHLSSSEDNEEYTNLQLNKFQEVVRNLEQEGYRIPLKHIACTASATAFIESRFDLIRLGIGLYGLPSYKASTRSKIKKPNLIPALSWKAKIIQVKKVPKGTYVGYGCTYKTKRQSLIAVLPVGYFEGYDRKLSNSGEVLVSGKKCPVIGRVCMNLLMVDVTKVKDVKVYEEAVLVGKQGQNSMTADDLAKKIGTINYEVVARINPNIQRILTQ